MIEHPPRRDHAASGKGDMASGTAEERRSVPFWQVIVLGFATALFGLAVLVWPAATVRTLGVLVGIWLTVAGIARILGAFASKRGTGRQVLSGTVGIILLIGGVACLRNVTKGVTVLAFLIAVAWILSGMAEFVIAFQAAGTTRMWLIALGVISVAIGLVFMLWPSLSLATIVIMTGISGLVIGIGEIAFAFQIRRSTATP